MDALERDALEVLSLVRSVKNSFAPINRAPPEVISLIPDCWDEDGWDRNLITLTHVCRGWRTLFTSRPSLWSFLDCRDIDKTQTYIERSKAAPLEICLEDSHDSFYTKEAFLLVTPQIGRLKYLTILTGKPPDIISYFFRRAPLLEELNIGFRRPASVLSDAFLDGDLSSLRELTLDGAITHLPWKDLSNLTGFILRNISADRITTTQLLNFFENAPLLQTITLDNSIPDSSDTPPGRTVSLFHLKELSITAQSAHSILLDHLSIPSGALMVLEFDFSGDTSIVPDYLPRPSENIKTLSCVTTINLLLSVTEKFLRLGGPGGETYVFGHRVAGGNAPPHVVDCQILHSLDQSILSTTRRLAISMLRLPILRVNKSQAFRTLCHMSNLRALTLTKCHNLPFILALDPKRTPSNLILCPKLEELTFYIEGRDSCHITAMLSMVEERALRGVKLSSITIVGLGDLVPGKEAFRLREYVTHVDYKVDDAAPNWDNLPGEMCYGDYGKE